MRNRSLILTCGLLLAVLAAPADAAVFAKYDGVDGESKDSRHQRWIDVLSIDWGAAREDATTGTSRRRGGAVVEDLTLTIEYEKATPKLLEKCLMGQVIPKLEIELTNSSGTSYLKYELTNVIVSGYQVSGSTAGKPKVVLSHSFERVKVTYTEIDSRGRAGAKSETTWNTATGTK